MADIIQLRRDTAERWAMVNPVLKEGEMGIVTDNYNQYKIGNGIDAWNDLPLRGYNGNVVSELGDDFNSVISQGGITNLLKYIVGNDNKIEIGESNFDVLDNVKTAGFYVLTTNGFPAYHMLVTMDNMLHGYNQWLFGNLVLTNGAIINGEHRFGEFNIICRTFSLRTQGASSENVELTDRTWTKWRYLQSFFLRDKDGNIGNEEKTLGEGAIENKITVIQNNIIELVEELSSNLPRVINKTVSSSDVTLALANGEENLGSDTIIEAATPEKAGVMSAQDKIDLNNLKDQMTGAGKISGVLNLTSSTCISSLMAMKENELRLYIAGDSNGDYPAKNGDKYVKVNDTVKVANFLNTDSSLYVNVGDIIAVIGYKTLLGITKVCRIIPLNDAKAGLTDGIMTKGDKGVLSQLETNVSELSDRVALRHYGESNMNNALNQGIYPWCTLGRPNGSTGAYTCIVRKSYNADGGGYYTIEQTAYGREGELGQVYKRIIFQKNDGSDTQYGEWKAISNTIDNRGTVGSEKDIVEPGWYNFNGDDMGPNGYHKECQIIKIAETAGSYLQIAAYPNGDKYIRCIHDGYTTNWTKIRSIDEITVIEKDLTDFTSYAIVTEDELNKIDKDLNAFNPIGISVTVGELAAITFTNLNLFKGENTRTSLSSVCYGNYDKFTNTTDEYRLLIYWDTQDDAYKLRVIKVSKNDGLLLDYNIPESNTLEITVEDWNEISLSPLANYILIKVTDSNGNVYQFNTPPQQFSNSDYSEYVWTYNSPTQVGTTIFYMRHDNTTDTYVAGLTYKS